MGLKYSDNQKVSSFPDTRCIEIPPPSPLLQLLGTHNLSCTRLPQGRSFLLELWSLDREGHPFIQLSAMPQQQTQLNVIIAMLGQKPLLYTKHLKEIRHTMQGIWHESSGSQAKFKCSILILKKKKKINLQALPRHFTSNWRVNCVYLTVSQQMNRDYTT